MNFSRNYLAAVYTFMFCYEKLKAVRLELWLSLGALVVALSSCFLQKSELENAINQLQETRNQAYSAEKQAEAALAQNKLSEIDRFREHLLNMSSALKSSGKAWDEMLRNSAGVFPMQYSSYELIEELDDQRVKVRETISFELAHKTAAGKFAFRNALIGAANLQENIPAITSYEAAVSLEPEITADISAMEYVILASYAHALEGVTCAENYMNKALEKYKGSTASFKKVLLYTTLAEIYYLHSPALSPEKGAKLYERAKDLLNELPAKDKSVLIEFEVWSGWATAEFSEGHENEGAKLFDQARQILERVPLQEYDRRKLLISFLEDCEKARYEGELDTGGPYIVGETTIYKSEFEDRKLNSRVLTPRPQVILQDDPANSVIPPAP